MVRHPFRHFAILASLALGLIGCATDDDNGDPDDISGSERISSPERDTTPRQTDRDIDQGTRNREVPDRAELLSNWRNDKLSYRSTQNGTLYIYDELNNRTIYSTPLRDGDRFVLDRSTNQASVNGKVVYEANRNDRHSYRVYFAHD